MNCERDARFWKLDTEMEERWNRFEGGLLTIQTLCFIARSINATPAFTKWLLEFLGILEDSSEHAGIVSMGF